MPELPLDDILDLVNQYISAASGSDDSMALWSVLGESGVDKTILFNLAVILARVERRAIRAHLL